MCDFEDTDIKGKTLADEQKRIEEILERFGYAPVDEYENSSGTVLFTKYEKFGIGVRIERNIY
jgi:hypothetical protein